MFFVVQAITSVFVAQAMISVFVSPGNDQCLLQLGPNGGGQLQLGSGGWLQLVDLTLHLVSVCGGGDPVVVCWWW